MKRPTKIRICHQRASMLFYPAALPLSAQTLTYTAGVIRRHRRTIGSTWRKLSPGRQALLVLVYLGKGETFAGDLRGRGLVLLSRAGAGIPSVRRKYRVIVLIGMLLLLGDLGVSAGLVLAVVVSAWRLRPSQLARPGVSALGRWAALIAAVTLLGLVVFGNVQLLISGYEDGRPSLAQVAGTWTDSAVGGTATLRIFPDGTFTATGLPPDTDSSTGHDVTVQALPADEHGTWQMTRGDGEWYVLFSLSGGPQVRFDIVPPSQGGDLLGANFTYIQGQFSLPTIWGFDRTSPDPGYSAGLRASPSRE
jgi:hypothetical protein